ncbi:hypothetical protein WA158_000868 [Blastocystis sp. Blastoise]
MSEIILFHFCNEETLGISVVFLSQHPQCLLKTLYDETKKSNNELEECSTDLPILALEKVIYMFEHSQNDLSFIDEKDIPIIIETLDVFFSNCECPFRSPLINEYHNHFQHFCSQWNVEFYDSSLYNKDILHISYSCPSVQLNHSNTISNYIVIFHKLIHEYKIDVIGILYLFTYNEDITAVIPSELLDIFPFASSLRVANLSDLHDIYHDIVFYIHTLSSPLEQDILEKPHLSTLFIPFDGCNYEFCKYILTHVNNCYIEEIQLYFTKVLKNIDIINLYKNQHFSHIKRIYFNSFFLQSLSEGELTEFITIEEHKQINQIKIDIDIDENTEKTSGYIVSALSLINMKNFPRLSTLFFNVDQYNTCSMEGIVTWLKKHSKMNIQTIFLNYCNINSFLFLQELQKRNTNLYIDTLDLTHLSRGSNYISLLMSISPRIKGIKSLCFPRYKCDWKSIAQLEQFLKSDIFSNIQSITINKNIWVIQEMFRGIYKHNMNHIQSIQFCYFKDIECIDVLTHCLNNLKEGELDFLKELRFESCDLPLTLCDAIANLLTRNILHTLSSLHIHAIKNSPAGLAAILLALVSSCPKTLKELSINIDMWEYKETMVLCMSPPLDSHIYHTVNATHNLSPMPPSSPLVTAKNTVASPTFQSRQTASMPSFSTQSLSLPSSLIKLSLKFMNSEAYNVHSLLILFDKGFFSNIQVLSITTHSVDNRFPAVIQQAISHGNLSKIRNLNLNFINIPFSKHVLQLLQSINSLSTPLLTRLSITCPQFNFTRNDYVSAISNNIQQLKCDSE